jgi:4a-hydroxytetrahydrobiopterin dehydratase
MAQDLDPATLASEPVRPADAATHPLDPEAVADLARGLDRAWQVEPDRLWRSFHFPTFSAAFGLATRIALLAEASGHHPELTVAWGTLTVTWTTDAIGAVSANDVIMAAKVDRLVARGLAIRE